MSLLLNCVCVDLDPAVVKPNDIIVLAQGEEMKATCNALSSLPTITTWFKVIYANISE